MLKKVEVAQIEDFHDECSAVVDKLKAEREKFLVDNAGVFDRLAKIDAAIAEAQPDVVLSRDAVALHHQGRRLNMDEAKLKEYHNTLVDQAKAGDGTSLEKAKTLRPLFGSIDRVRERMGEREKV